MSQPDQLTDAGEIFYFRDGTWTSRTGMCVSTTRSYALTQKFVERHGRSPAHVVVIRERPATKAQKLKAERTKAALVRASVAKALARRGSDSDQ